MGEDEWVNDAMKDDSVVVELLMRLKQSEAAAVAAKIPVLMMTSLEWGVRLPRSRQVIRCSNNVQIKKEGESTRASPTTPLSWSGGGTSVSGGGGGGGCVGGGATVGDGFEESSKPIKRPSAAGRSKVNGTNEPTNRRSRKKKTFAELKEEESLLLKERIHLKKELATLAITHEEQEARNSQLKRLKLDLQLQSAKQTFSADVTNEGIYNQSYNREIGQMPTTLPMVGTCQDLDAAAVCPLTTLPTDPSSEQEDIETRQSLFELPDLNVPLEEDSGSEVLYGMS
ncbi:hypothetical protein BVC80_1803g11 [Macleaya cordata]|uniref:Uncharacterized protein n=1 Tax=Macleaya cordata TaxID=56857 RepID=A0A200QQY9_MACCD|nr:hypothetical protein BVC80_1803g11 [Macleaya cordata]